MSSNPFGPPPPEKPTKPQKAPPLNPFAASINHGTSASTAGKIGNPPPKPSFLLNKESSLPGKPSNPFSHENLTSSPGNPFGTEDQPTEKTRASMPGIPVPVEVKVETIVAPLPPAVPAVPPSPVNKENDLHLEPASEAATPLTPPPPPPPVPPAEISTPLFAPPSLPPGPPPDLSPPPLPPKPKSLSSATVTVDERILPTPTAARNENDDDPFSIDAKRHQLGSKSSKVIANPFAPADTIESSPTISDSFDSSNPHHFRSTSPPIPYDKLEQWAKEDALNARSTSTAGSSDPFASSNTHIIPNSVPVPYDKFREWGVFGPAKPPKQMKDSKGYPAVNCSSDPFASNSDDPFISSTSHTRADQTSTADPFATPGSDSFPGFSSHQSATSSSFDNFDFPTSDPFATTAPSQPKQSSPAKHSEPPPLPPKRSSFRQETSDPKDSTFSQHHSEPHELKAPEPQIDDDPYLIVTNKPPPVIPTRTETKPVVKPREEVRKSITKPGEDPFDLPIPGLEKPKKVEATKATDPNASLPLKVLMEKNKSGAALPSTHVPPSSGPPPVTATAASNPVNPFSPPPKPTNDPPHEDSTDPFASSADPLTTDPFGDDPFGDPFTSQPSHSTANQHPAVETDFDIFDKPASKTSTTTSALPVADDFSVFENKAVSKPLINAPSSTAGPAPATATAGLAPPPLPAKRPSMTSSHTQSLHQPSKTSSNLLDGDWVDVSASKTTPAPASKPQQTVHDGTFDDFDPFSAPTDDPFAAGGSDPFHTQNTAASMTTSNSHEDMLEKFRMMYGVKSDLLAADNGDEDEDDDDDLAGGKGLVTKKTHDIYDSDFDDDLDISSAGKKTKATSSQPSTQVSGPPKDALEYGERLAKGLNSELIEGEIVTRLSTSSMLKKDWRDHYYVIIKGVLYLYKTKLDYQYNPQGTHCKRKIPITYNLSVTPLKAKDYKGFGTVYNFMIEEVMDYGRTSLGKFGSPYKPVIEALWKQLRALILYRRHVRANPPSQYK